MILTNITKIMCNKSNFEEKVAGIAVASQEKEKVDFTEFVKQLGKDYAEMIYEAAETPEDLRSTIDWADANFYEGEGLRHMLDDLKDGEDIVEVFDNMDWSEYHEYEVIFVEAAKDALEEDLREWKLNIADYAVVKCSSDIEKIGYEIEEEMGNIYTDYGYIHRYDDLEELDAESRFNALKYLMEKIEEAQELVEDCYEEISEVLEADVTAADGFCVWLPMMKFFGWNHTEIENCDYDPVEILDDLYGKVEQDYYRADEEVYEVEVER